MKDVLDLEKDKISFSSSLYEKIWTYLLSKKDKEKIENNGKVQIRFTLEKLTPMKTSKQLGYLHAEVYFKAWLSYMITEGTKIDEEEAIGKLKRACGMAYESGVPKSLASQHVDDVAAFIKRAVDYINQDMGVVVCESSKKWKERKKEIILY